MKLTSHKLEFKNPIFYSQTIGDDDMQVTVRRGTKWSRRVSPGMTVTVQETDGDDIGEAEIKGVLVTTLRHMPNEVLHREHDPSCQTPKGLFKELCRVYGDFNPSEQVTVLFFRFVKDRE